MSASLELEADYLEWQQIAETEGDAIRAGDFIQASACQNSLKALQARIIQHTALAQAESGGDESVEASRRVRIRQLIELEQRNYSLLDSRVRSARAELDKLQQANHTLGRIQRSYAPARQSGWSSFS